MNERLERRLTDQEPKTFQDALLVIAILKKELEQTRSLLDHDFKTGLLSGRSWEQYYSKKLDDLIADYHLLTENEKRLVPRHVLCLIDMNGLKKINDEFGYESGDLAISSVANSIEKTIRIEDLLFRLNTAGDEFVVISKFIPNNVECLSFIASLEQRLKDAVAENSQNKYSVSVGSSCLEDYLSTKDAQKIAEQRMKEDKNQYYENLKNKFGTKLMQLLKKYLT
jgi:diguanylate cyclase (GGDEF)-like protein